MGAGLGFKDFTTGEVLTANDVDGYLMQGVWVFADAAARTAAVTSPQEGNMSFLKDTNSTEYYSGSAWVAVGGASATTYTLINAGGTALSGSSTTVSGISGKNKLFVYVAGMSSSSASAYCLGGINNDFTSNYRWFGLTSTNGAGATGDGTATGTELFFGQMGNAAADTISGSCFIDGANNTGIKPYTMASRATGTTSNDSPVLQGFYVGTSTVSSIVIKTDAGSFDAGTVYVYGA
jgi:hypothetical protein